MHPIIVRLSMCGLLWSLCSAAGSAQEVQSLLVRIKAVGKEGVGNVEAARAFRLLVAHGPGVLPDVLAGMDDASPVAINWLRGAVEAIQDKALNSGQKIPADKIEAFITDTRHAGPARRLAYECLVRVDPTAPTRLLPKMLDDPSSELRRDAVAERLTHGKNAAWKGDDVHKKFYQDLLKHARDSDQVTQICAVLKKKHQLDIDLTKHFGFVTAWELVGPFDNVKGVGFNHVYPPEKGVDAKAVYAGKDKDVVGWKSHTTKEKLGLVDLTKVFGKLKGAVVYGHAAFLAPAEHPVEIRAGSNNALRIWLNGKEIYFREEYHHGKEMDQHVGKGVFQKGRNEILIKVCQNEQTDSWAQEWSFQLRVCDALGAAIPLNQVAP